MRIFNKEKNDGLSEKIIGSSTFVVSKAKLSNCDKNLEKLIASINSVEDLIGVDQPDLAVIISILVSAGWNLNDDVFSKEELWQSKDTPKHKPINDNHDADVILGHIVQSKAVNKDGEDILLSENDPIPDEFDLEVAGVLYKQLLGDKVGKILNDVNSGEMFVSMECWFDDFSYAFKNPSTGESKIVERDEKTSFLTKYLRSYGGKGEFQGYKIGRVLKNIVFGGQGLVKNPANPRSIIKLAANINSEDKENIGSNDMDELNKQLSEALSNLASKDETIKKLSEQIASVSNDFAKKEKEINEKIDQLQKDLASTKEALASAEKEKVETVANLEKVTKELNNMKQAEKAKQRFEELSKLKNIPDTEKEVVIKELSGMNDETFASVLKYAKMNVVESKASEKNDLSNSLETAVEDNKDDVEFQVADENQEVKEVEVALQLANLLLNVNDEDNKSNDGE